MNEELKDKYLAWLNDAYAMEKNIAEMLEKQSKAAKDYPEIQARIEQHLDETNNHADKIKDCIERNGGNISDIKSTLSQLMGNASALLNSAMPDTIVKAAIADYAIEHFELASYRALWETAGQLGDDETISVIEEIIKEEQEMADWLEENLPLAVNEYLSNIS